MSLSDFCGKGLIKALMMMRMMNFITPVGVVRISGLILDKNMTMLDHISSVCQRCNYQKRQIRRVRKSLSAASKLFLVLALVHSRLDYCNSVLHSSGVARKLRLRGQNRKVPSPSPL